MSTDILPAGVGLALVDALICKAFPSTRTRRSVAYMLGAHELLLASAGIGSSTCPYATGTAEFDAYFAGADEGRAIWTRHQNEAAQ